MTSGLERLSNLLSKKDSVFVSDLLREAKVNELDETLSTTRLNHLIDKGYERITLQLDLGENPISANLRVEPSEECDASVPR